MQVDCQDIRTVLSTDVEVQHLPDENRILRDILAHLRNCDQCRDEHSPEVRGNLAHRLVMSAE